MNEQLRFLVNLQEVDSALLALADRIEALPKRLNKAKALLSEAEALKQKLHKRYEELSKKKKLKDSEVDERQDAIDKLRARGGDIKTNKEYEAHLKEIETFEKSKYDSEEEVILLMEEIEGIMEALQKSEDEVKQAESELEMSQRELDEEKRKIEQEVEAKRSERRTIVEVIDKEIYSQYMNILKRLGDIAIVPVEKEVCLGCNTNVPPQLYSDVKESDKIITCFYCKRFLYYKEKQA